MKGTKVRVKPSKIIHTAYVDTFATLPQQCC